MTVVSYTTFSDSTFISFFFPPKTHFSFPHLFQTLNPSPPDSDGRLFFSPVISCSLIYGSLSTFISGSSSFFYPLAYSPLDQTVRVLPFQSRLRVLQYFRSCLRRSSVFWVVDLHSRLRRRSSSPVGRSSSIWLRLHRSTRPSSPVRVSPSPLSNISVLQYSR